MGFNVITNTKFSVEDIQQIIIDRIKSNVYDNEDFDDKILQHIKNIAFSYLNNKESVDDITVSQLNIIYKFLLRKFNALIEIKEALKLKSYLSPFTEISQSLDEYMLTEDIKETTIDSIYIKITKDINNLLDHLGFCYGIIGKIIEEKK